jgi:hypothetical protein
MYFLKQVRYLNLTCGIDVGGAAPPAAEGAPDELLAAA